jgi:hypothetical protein
MLGTLGSVTVSACCCCCAHLLQLAADQLLHEA